MYECQGAHCMLAFLAFLARVTVREQLPIEVQSQLKAAQVQ